MEIWEEYHFYFNIDLLNDLSLIFIKHKQLAYTHVVIHLDTGFLKKKGSRGGLL